MKHTNTRGSVGMLSRKIGDLRLNLEAFQVELVS